MLVMHLLHLFGHALPPQSQDLVANQPVIVVITSGLIQQHIIKGFPHHSGYTYALWYYQGLTHPR